MKLVHVIQRYAPAVGGAERWCMEVARRQAARGHRVRVLTLDIVREQEFWEEPRPDDAHFRLGRLDLVDGVEVRRFRRSLPIWTLHHLVLRGLLDRGLGIHLLGPHSREMLAELDVEIDWADVVHLHTLPYPHNAFGLRAARRRRRPVILTPHFHRGHPVYERRHQYRWLRRADAVLVISEDERAALVERGVDAARITVTGCGHDGTVADGAARARAVGLLRRRLGLDPGTRVVACVARKSREKGLPALAGAVALLRREGRSVALALAGPELPWFAGWWRDLPAEQRAAIHDLGQVSEADKAMLLQGADVFAMPSRYEAFGLVFLEAWAAGLPVVAGRDGAQPEVVGEGGRTVPFDDPAATAAALSEMLDRPAAAAAAVAAGRRALATRHTWERVADDVLGAARRLHAGPLRIVAAANMYPPHVQGGAELAMAGQLRRLADRGHPVRVLAGRLDERAPRHRTEDEEGVPPVRRLVLHGRDLSADYANHLNPEAERQFGRLLDECAPDVVHLHNLAGLGVGLIHQAADLGLPVVLTLHDYWGLCHRNTLTRRDGSLCDGPGLDCRRCLASMAADGPLPVAARRTDLMAALDRVRLFLAPSRYLAGRFQAAGFDAGRLRILPNGLRLERFAGSGPAPADGPLLFLGYLGRHKGVEVLLRALARPEAKGLTGVIAGDGGERGELEALAAGLGLADRVRFAGFVPPERIPEMLAACRALVVPSLWPENAPVTITEAMAAGRPVVASDLGGIPELVADGRTGLLVPAGDEAALALALGRLQARPGLAARLGAAGREAARSMDLDRVADELESIYRGLLDRRPPAPAPRRALALAAPFQEWDDPDLLSALAEAESMLGPLLLQPWDGLRRVPRDPRRRLPPAALLVRERDGLEPAAEARELGVPLVAWAAAGSPLARLAGTAGGEAAAEARRVGRLLARRLADPGPSQEPDGDPAAIRAAGRR